MVGEGSRLFRRRDTERSPMRIMNACLASENLLAGWSLFMEIPKHLVKDLAAGAVMEGAKPPRKLLVKSWSR
jgi:hypothetical protein